MRAPPLSPLLIHQVAPHDPEAPPAEPPTSGFVFPKGTAGIADGPVVHVDSMLVSQLLDAASRGNTRMIGTLLEDNAKAGLTASSSNDAINGRKRRQGPAPSARRSGRTSTLVGADAGSGGAGAAPVLGAAAAAAGAAAGRTAALRRPSDGPQPRRRAGADDAERRRRMSASDPVDPVDGADGAASGGTRLAAAVAAAAAAARGRPAARASSGRARTTP